MVQEGTAWERPAGARMVDADGVDVPAGTTSASGLGALRVVAAGEVGDVSPGRREQRRRVAAWRRVGGQPDRPPLRVDQGPVRDRGAAPEWGDLAERVAVARSLVNGLLDEHFDSERRGIDPANRIMVLSERRNPSERHRVTQDGMALLRTVNETGEMILAEVDARYGDRLAALDERIEAARAEYERFRYEELDRRTALRERQLAVARRRLDELSMERAGVSHEELVARAGVALPLSELTPRRRNKWHKALDDVSVALAQDPELRAVEREMRDLGDELREALRPVNRLQQRREVLFRDALVEGLRAAGVDLAEGNEIGLYRSSDPLGQQRRAAIQAAVRFFPRRWAQVVGETNDSLRHQEGARGAIQPQFDRPYLAEMIRLSRRSGSWDPDGNDYFAVAAHEVGHLMELPEVRMLEHLFYQARTAGEAAVPYGRSEQESVRPDGFFHRYTGKTYGGRPENVYELMSMLSGRVFGLDRSQDGYPDREHLAWGLGVLASVEPGHDPEELRRIRRSTGYPGVVSAPEPERPLTYSTSEGAGDTRRLEAFDDDGTLVGYVEYARDGNRAAVSELYAAPGEDAAAEGLLGRLRERFDVDDEAVRREETSSFRVLYHGTVVPFGEGDEILPAASTGRAVNFLSETDPAFAYATEDPEAAWHYAEMMAMNRGGVPRVFRVEPIGDDVEEDPQRRPDGGSRGNFDGDRRSTTGFRVVGEEPPPDDVADGDWEDPDPDVATPVRARRVTLPYRPGTGDDEAERAEAAARYRANVEAAVAELLDGLDDEDLDTVEEYGRDRLVEGAAARAEAWAVAELDGYRRGTPAIGISGDALEAVLRDGRYLTQYESGTSGGMFSPERRRQVERDQMGIPAELEDRLRPVYGYVPVDNTIPLAFDDAARWYGEFAIIAKDAVRERTTISLGDSLDHSLHPVPMIGDADRERQVAAIGGGFINDAALSGLVDILEEAELYDLADYYRMSDEDYDEDRVKYVEVQVHGGLTVEDIDHIVVSNLELMDEYHPELRATAARLGIEIREDW